MKLRHQISKTRITFTSRVGDVTATDHHSRLCFNLCKREATGYLSSRAKDIVDGFRLTLQDTRHSGSPHSLLAPMKSHLTWRQQHRVVS